MKLVRIEWKKQTGRKFWMIIALLLLFSFGVTFYFTREATESLSSMEDILLLNAGSALQNCESRLVGEREEKKISYYQEAAAAARDLVEGYRRRDPSVIIDAVHRYSTLQTRAKEYGIILDSRSLEDAVVKKAVSSVLLEKGIRVYHEPLLGELCWDGSEAVTFFLEKYLLYLLPMITVLMFADSFQMERRCGGMKLLLTEPHARYVAVGRKYVTGILQSMAGVAAVLLGAFLGGLAGNGPGDPRYPIKAQRSFFFSGKESYLGEWQIWIRAGIVCFCAVLFLGAIALGVEIFVRDSVLSILIGMALCVGGEVAGRQLLAAQGGSGWVSCLPFAMTDGYGAAVGKTAVKPLKLQSAMAGLLSQRTVDVSVLTNPFPGVLYSLFLTAWAVLFLVIAAILFQRRDVM